MTNHSPLVTVILTCFNRSETINRAIKSVFNQTYPNIELIVIDDHSTDDSFYQIQQTLYDLGQIAGRRSVVLVNSKNLGQNASINRAFANSSGYYISFLDSDDAFHRDFVECMEKVMLHNKNIHFSYCRMTGSSRWKIEGCKQYGSVLENLGLCNLGSLFLSREAMKEIYPLPERLLPNDNCQDDAISFELSKRFCFKHVPTELYIKYHSKNAITSNNRNNLIAYLKLLEIYKEDYLNYSTIRIWRRLHAKLGAKLGFPNLAYTQLFPEKEKILSFKRFTAILEYWLNYSYFLIMSYIKKVPQKCALMYRQVFR